MPEFILNHGTSEAGKRFAALDSFTQGYITAMFFTARDESDQDESGNPNENPDWSVADLAEETWTTIVDDCNAFISTFDAIEATASDASLSTWPDDEHAGRDFWYTRNDHGCGFWDGDWPEPYAAALTKSAKAFRETDLYRGDDGKLYLE